MKLKYLKDSDYQANLIVLKGAAAANLVYAIVWILNLIHVFFIDPNIMNTGIGISTFLFALMFCTGKAMGLENPKTKYVLIAFSVAFITSINIMLTYHSILASTLPLILSVQYRKKKILWYTCWLVMLGQAATVYGGYHFGLCNANWVLYTCYTTDSFMQMLLNNDVTIAEPGISRTLAMFLYYVLPQWMILGCFVPTLLLLSAQIEARSQRDLVKHRQESLDYMTGLGNRTLYNNMLKDYYPNVKQMAVIMWDIRNLRKISDEQGPEMGDRLISMMADSIKPFRSEHVRPFRIAGSKFAMLLKGYNLDNCTRIIDQWRVNVEKLNSNSPVKLCAAIGYAQGSGSDSDLAVAQAEKMLTDYKSVSDY